MSRHNRFSFWLWRPWPRTIAWAILIFIGCSVPMRKGPSIDFPLAPDKIAHGFAYIVLAALATHAAWRPGRSLVRVIVVVVATIAYGLLIEGWQALLLYRGCELGDVIANTVGTLIGTGLAVGAGLKYSPRAPTQRRK